MKKIEDVIKNYSDWEEITKEEYENAKNKLPNEEFKEKYSADEGPFISKYRKAIYPKTSDLQFLVLGDMLDEIKRLREEQKEIRKSTSVIKKIMVFLLVVFIINFILSIVFGVFF